jgi:hypothetical protein
VVFAPLRSEGHHRVTDQQRKIAHIPMVRWTNGLSRCIPILASPEVLALSGEEGTSSLRCQQGQTPAMS